MKNREIKFRLWDAHENKFIEDGFGVSQDGKYYIDEFGNQYKLGDEWNILSQCTGLKDKNGVEIYEGDIVYCFDDTPTDPVIPITDVRGVVVYTEHGYMLDCAEEQFSLHVNYGYIEHIEVLGNIHEHPNLLK